MNTENELIIFSPVQLKVVDGDSDSIRFPNRYLEGLTKFSEYWPGPVLLYTEFTANEFDDFNIVTRKKSELPFKVEAISYKNITTELFQNKKRLVFAFLGFNEDHISLVCKKAGVPCIYIAEFNLRTRKDIIRTSVCNPFKKIRRLIWEEFAEKRFLGALKIADGLQCCGTPTYYDYKDVNKNTLLFFDSRMTEDMFIAENDLITRCNSLSDQRPIRLAYAGRLIDMKGAYDLAEVACELKKLGVNFQMDIGGDGYLRGAIKKRVEEAGAGESVRLVGPLEFKTQLVPLLKNIDLFVCCHNQGDPSSIYLEAMSCGVPIVGYSNQMFEGLARYSNTGWLVDMKKPKLLAKKIAELSQNKEEIRSMSLRSLTFARKYSFDNNIKMRITHLINIAEAYYKKNNLDK